MPASVCEPVSAALRTSLAGAGPGDGAEGRLRGALLTEVEFEAAGSYHASLDSLKSKYVVLRPPHAHPHHSLHPLLPHPHAGKLQLPAAENCKNGDSGLPSAKRVLFPVERVSLGWSRGGRSWGVGSGMQNVGNTCYLNSTLQALFHVPAFANWLMSDTAHAEDCRHAEGCVICGMRATLMATQKGGGAPIKPWQVYSKLRLICRHLTPGRQEDAHEFLRYLVEAMEKSFLARCPGGDKLEQYSKETTPLNQTLGGYLRSTVRCLACGHLSTTYQHFQDLLLDIRKHSTLDEALDSFFSRERLEDLGYKCEACNKKVSATKQFFIERAPMVLCIALKRFSLAGGKLSKHIQFRKKIILSKYTHHKLSAVPLSYRLVSMVTHLGPSQNCGHYTAIGQAPNGNYYQFDDSCVRPLPLSAVLGTNAYIMFYEKENPSEETIVSNSNAASTSNAVYGPQLPDNREKSPLKLNFYKNDERKTFVVVNTESKIEKPPIILNSTLSNEPNCSKAEPWVLKQNGDIEKVKTNGSFNENSKNFITKGSKLIHSETNGIKNVSISNGTHKTEKKESTLKIDKKPENGELKKNDCNTKLVPYDSESESGDEKRDGQTGDRPSRTEGLVVTTKATHCVWTVSNESSRPLLSPSLNGVVNNKIRENNTASQPEENGSPNTSTSSMSSAEETTGQRTPAHGAPGLPAPPAPPAPPGPHHGPQDGGNGQQSSGGAGDASARNDTLNRLQHMSHRGYGAPVSSWAGTQAGMGRQVYEERREERKRALEGADEMDAGRNKRVKKFNRLNGSHEHRGYGAPAPFQQPYRHNGYNPFQEKQNRQHWGGGGGGGSGGGGFNKYRGDRRPPPHHFHNKRFNRYGNNNHHYRRH